MRNRRLYFFIILTCTLNCCKQKDADEKDDGYVKVDDYSVTTKKLDSKDWTCRELRTETVCIPKNWKQVETDKALFYASLGNDNESTYFGITAYSEDVEPLNYLKGMYKAFLDDTVERATGYKLTELVFPKKTAYYGEFYLKKHDVEYCFFLMFWKFEGITYDFGLKAELKEKDKYYQLFQTILYNFQSRGKHPFSEKDEMEKIRHLNFENL